MRIQRARAKIWLGRSLRQVVAAALLSVGVLFCLPGILSGGIPYIKDPRWLNHFLRPGTQPPVEYRPPPGPRESCTAADGRRNDPGAVYG